MNETERLRHKTEIYVLFIVNTDNFVVILFLNIITIDYHLFTQQCPDMMVK